MPTQLQVGALLLELRGQTRSHRMHSDTTWEGRMGQERQERSRHLECQEAQVEPVRSRLVHIQRMELAAKPAHSVGFARQLVRRLSGEGSMEFTR